MVINRKYEWKPVVEKGESDRSRRSLLSATQTGFKQILETSNRSISRSAKEVAARLPGVEIAQELLKTAIDSAVVAIPRQLEYLRGLSQLLPSTIRPPASISNSTSERSGEPMIQEPVPTKVVEMPLASEEPNVVDSSSTFDPEQNDLGPEDTDSEPASVLDDEAARVDSRTASAFDHEAEQVDSRPASPLDDEAAQVDSEPASPFDDEAAQVDSEPASAFDDEAAQIDSRPVSPFDDEAAQIDSLPDATIEAKREDKQCAFEFYDDQIPDAASDDAAMGFALREHSESAAQTTRFELEPPRTRFVARHLASQGYVSLALSIYRQLLLGDPDDQALKQEAEEIQNGQPVFDSAVALPGSLPSVSRIGLMDEENRITFVNSDRNELTVNWNITPKGVQRAQSVLGEPGELCLRVFEVASDPDAVVRSTIVEHGPVQASGTWTARELSINSRRAVAIGLRKERRFAAITHIAFPESSAASD